jgi:DNA-directed RNA polymerase beta subunit
MLGINALNPWVAHDSSARAQMTGSHLAQAPVLVNPSIRWIQTGVEYEHADYAYHVVAPCDLTVLYVVPFYKRTLDTSSINENPVTYLIYQSHETREIGVIELPIFHNNGGKFGFKFEHGPAYLKAVSKGQLAKGEIILRAPCVSEDGDLMTGVQLNVAFMSHYMTAEDSIVVSETAAKKHLLTRTLQSVTVSCDSNRIPRNLYGQNGEYKAFPDIGDFVRDDGLLMSVIDPDNNAGTEADLMLPAERHLDALKNPDLIFDDRYYVPPGGRVVDVRVYHQARYKDLTTVDTQALKYFEASKRFYNTMLDIQSDLKRKYGGAPILTPELSNLLTNCLKISSNDPAVKRAMLVYKQEVLGQWRIDFTIEYTREVTVGSKLTDLHAGKGVCCKVWPDEWMPVDSAGNRADLIMDPNGHINRMNPGRSFEQYECAAITHATKQLKSMLGLTGTYSEGAARVKLGMVAPEVIEAAFKYATELQGKFYPALYESIKAGHIGSDRINYLAPMVANSIPIYCPTDNPKNHIDIVLDIENSIYRPPYGPVTYRGYYGNQVVTKNPIRIGSCYIVLLSKLGDDWNATHSGTRQAHGVPAAVTTFSKYGTPWRFQPTRVLGESETRNVTAYCGGRVMAEIIHNSCSPQEAEEVAKHIMRADEPTNITRIVDRNKIPFGTSRPMVMVKHMLACAGFSFGYKRMDPPIQRRHEFAQN